MNKISTCMSIKYSAYFTCKKVSGIVETFEESNDI